MKHFIFTFWHSMSHAPSLLFPLQTSTIHFPLFPLALQPDLAKTRCEKVQGNLSLEVKKEIERRFQHQDLQGDHQPWILSFRQKECIHRITWLINQDFRSRNFNLTKFTTPSTFSCWKIRFKTKVSACSSSPSEAMLWIKEVEMVDSYEELKSSRSVTGYTHFPNFEMLCARIASALNKIIQNSLLFFSKKKKKVSLEEGTACSERVPFPSWKTDRLPDLRRTSGSPEPMILSRLMPTYLLLVFEMTIFRNSIQNGTKFYCLWPRCHLMTSLKACTKIRKRESAQLQTVLELYLMEIHQKISMPNFQKLKTMVKRRYRSETSIANFWRQARETWNRCSGYESQGSKRCWKRTRRLLSMESKRTVFERRQVYFWARWRWACKTDTKNRFHPLSHQLQKHEVEVRREKRNVRGRSQSGKFNRQPCKYFLKGTCTNSPCEYWHLPECQFYKSQLVCKFGEKCSFAHRQVEGQPNKKSKKDGDKSAVAFWKMYDSWVAYIRTQKQVSGKRKDHRLEKSTSQTSSSAQPLRCEIWG